MSPLMVAAGIFLVPCEAPCVYRIEYENRIEPAGRPESVYTVEPGIHLYHVRRPNRRSESHDTLEVVDLPAGFVAIPHLLDLHEGEAGVIEIHRFEGM